MEDKCYHQLHWFNQFYESFEDPCNKMFCNLSCLEKESAYDLFSVIMLATKCKRKHFNIGPKEKPHVFFNLKAWCDKEEELRLQSRATRKQFSKVFRLSEIRRAKCAVSHAILFQLHPEQSWIQLSHNQGNGMSQIFLQIWHYVSPNKEKEDEQTPQSDPSFTSEFLTV